MIYPRGRSHRLALCGLACLARASVCCAALQQPVKIDLPEQPREGRPTRVAGQTEARGESRRLLPRSTYVGVGRPVWAVISTVGSDATDTALEIHLLAAVTAEVLERANCDPAAGEVDLAQLFPSLWTSPERGVVYAQLLAAGEKSGPALVLQPLRTPLYAPRMDKEGLPQFPTPSARSRILSGLRIYPDQHAVFETTLGGLEFRLRPDEAPNTVWNLRHLIEGGFYTDIEVHRVASLVGKANPDIIQFGDPNGTGQGGPGYMIDLEPSRLPHGYGVLSMARTSDPNSGGSQMFVGLTKSGTAFLDGKYTAFGELVRGEEPLQRIAQSPVAAGDKPLNPPVIRSARLVDAPPYGDGPRPIADPTGRPVPR